MAVEKEEVYQGLLKPARLLWLPVQAAIIWGLPCPVIFMWTENWYSFLLMIITYPFFYALGQWDPNFFDVIMTTTKHFGKAPNKKIWGGYSYEP